MDNQFILDQRYMASAIRFARRNLGKTCDNPAVGALLVKNKEIIASAVTAISGRPHAETQLLIEAGTKAAGATLYVTLEPCSHYGQTPPCVNAIIKAQIARVVIGLQDPDTRVCGRSVKLLQNAGISVDINILAEEINKQIADYLTLKIKKRPYVILKLASYKDAVIGCNDERLLITGKIAWRQSQMLRSRQQAILVSTNTLLLDNPSLTCRLEGLEQFSPIRLVIDRNLRLSLSSNILQNLRQIPTWIFCDITAPKDKLVALENMGCRIIRGKFVNGQLDLDYMLDFLANEKISSLLVEGGKKLANSFLSANLVDKFIHIESQRETYINSINCIRINDILNNLPKSFTLDNSAYYGDDNWYEWLRKV
ncbi:bifunctional diaminohydroxyphosphoribosylaminopyrimidine deaminase/5-amino-6-(5-phosphoribosylamino)uracil reductase RibD [Bartonella sp. DGB1]|uniref:bifunctional diaminohydroxyphosphoribosylaminopyrimidine deaminase/5-amino-6-(5-phosphoribosylamino)uracil reductase RibD n=1 Tax=Bartonella sp. DGB1 TaxID=3239807 RepID=UPI003524D148